MNFYAYDVDMIAQHIPAFARDAPALPVSLNNGEGTRELTEEEASLLFWWLWWNRRNTIITQMCSLCTENGEYFASSS